MHLLYKSLILCSYLLFKYLGYKIIPSVLASGEPGRGIFPSSFLDSHENKEKCSKNVSIWYQNVSLTLIKNSNVQGKKIRLCMRKCKKYKMFF